MSEPKTIKINEVEYVRKDEANLQPAANLDGKPFVIIRSYGAGVFAGYLSERCDKHQRVTMDGCIRLWRWTGATLSQVARDGIAGTGENRFSVPTDNHIILGVVEIIPTTEQARTAIQGVTPWEV